MIYGAVYAVNGEFRRKGCNTPRVRRCKPRPYKRIGGEAGRVFLQPPKEADGNRGEINCAKRYWTNFRATSCFALSSKAEE